MPAKTHFTAIPNMIDDDQRIDAAAYRVYGHYRRAAGESGAFWAGSREVAKACRISLATVAQAKRDLAEAGYIVVTREKRKDGYFAEHVRIVDIWQANTDRYRYGSIPVDIDTQTEVDRYPIVSRSIPKTGGIDTQPVTIKKNLKEEPKKNLKEEPATTERSPALQRMLDILGPRGLRTNAHFERLVNDRYAWRDLEEEAVRMVGWLDEEKQIKAKRKPTTPFVLKWLAKPTRETTQPRGQPTQEERFTLGRKQLDPKEYTQGPYANHRAMKS